MNPLDPASLALGAGGYFLNGARRTGRRRLHAAGETMDKHPIERLVEAMAADDDDAAKAAAIDLGRLGFQLMERHAKALEAIAYEMATKPPSDPNPAFEKLASDAHAEIRAEVGVVEPHLTLAMLKTWSEHAAPANALGQVSFARALLQNATDAIEALLAPQGERP